MSRTGLLALQLLVAVVALALWQFFATVPVLGKVVLPPFFFSNPIDVFGQVIHWFTTGVIWKHLAITLWESVLAFAIGSLGGVAVGFWFARQPTVAAVFDPYVRWPMRCRAWCWRRSSRCGWGSASGRRSRSG